MPILDAADLSAADAYAWLTGLVVPRPIAWVGTRSPAGVDNLAPHSYVTVVSSDPPVVAFVSVGTKDTLANARATGAFTISVVDRPHLEAMNATATALPAEVDEFAHVGLAAAEADLVEAPRVATSPAHLECRVRDVLEVGDGTLVLGDVVRLRIDDRVVAEPGADAAVDMPALDPVGRLAANQYMVLGEVVALDRPTAES